ncbi:MAG: hypothetical protein AAF433_16055 [Bacteroidota bacterium]
MKLQNLLLLLLLIISSCAEENFQVNDRLQQEAADELIFGMYNDGDVLSTNANYVLFGVKDYRQPSGPIVGLLSYLIDNQYQSSSQAIWEKAQSLITEFSMNVSQWDHEYSSSLQLFAFEAGHRAALAEPATENRNSILLECLEILYVQKAVDTDAYAEMLIAASPNLSQSEYQKHKRYILQVASDYIQEQEQSLRQRIEEFHRQQEDQTAADIARFRAEMLSIKGRYQDALLAIELLAPNSASH